MTVLKAHGVGVAWVAAAPIFTDVSFDLVPGFYGLVGANGAGKTTLLRVLSKEVAPHEGAIHVQPKGATIAYCPQTVDAPGLDVVRFAGACHGAANEIKGRLALEESSLHRWPTLSPGERKRWQIGAALFDDPDILLLDEPTNHLDSSARNRLLGALSRYRGICVIVSHDRAVLERLPHAILRVHRRRVAMYAGGFSEARAQWEGERRAREEAHAVAKERVRHVERRLDEARRAKQSAERSLSASSRMKNKNDHDARSMGRKVVAGWADARAGRAVETIRNEFLRARERIPEIERDATLGGKIFATYQKAPHAVLFHIDEERIYAGDHAVLHDVRMNIGREERIWVAGNNGSGKTTLLLALMRAHPRPERLLYLPQELPAESVASLVRALHSMNAEQRGRVLSVFSALGSDPERLLQRPEKDLGALSPGEARKLALASGLGKHAWGLVLDEPTNHLDLPTIERLERALSAYPGCIVLVTHDDAFAQAVTTRKIRLPLCGSS